MAELSAKDVQQLIGTLKGIGTALLVPHLDGKDKADAIRLSRLFLGLPALRK